jgi:hypothetical protein
MQRAGSLTNTSRYADMITAGHRPATSVNAMLTTTGISWTDNHQLQEQRHTLHTSTTWSAVAEYPRKERGYSRRSWRSDANLLGREAVAVLRPERFMMHYLFMQGSWRLKASAWLRAPHVQSPQQNPQLCHISEDSTCRTWHAHLLPSMLGFGSKLKQISTVSLVSCWEAAQCRPRALSSSSISPCTKHATGSVSSTPYTAFTPAT